MTEKELWKKFISENKTSPCEYEAWAFGVDADILADLVLRGEKTATASAYPLYELENEPLPKEGKYDILLNSENEAVCVLRTTKVYTVPFCEVTEEHARKEGEGDKSLAYWKKVHEECFTQWLGEAGLKFDHNMKVVCEEFEVVCRA